MGPRAGIGSLTLFLVAIAVLCVGRGAAAAQADPQTLTVTVAVCPMGYEGDDFAGVCDDRIARSYDVSVTDFSSPAPFAADVAPDGDGRTTVDLTGHTPASLTVGVSTAVNVGSRAVSCVAGGVPMAAAFVQSAAAIPIFQIDVDASADIACSVYIYGFENDVELLGVGATTTAGGNAERGPNDEGGVAASSAAVEDAGGGTESQVAALPNTGSGSAAAQGIGAGRVLPLALLLAVLAGGAIRLRRRGHASV